jgi:hypothetical protein
MPNRTMRTAAALLLATLWLPAQEAVSTPPKSSQGAPPLVVTMDFAGGSMAKFVAWIRGAEPNANIVVASRAEEAIVPSMEFRSVGLEQALECACLIAEGPVEVRVKGFSGRGAPIYTILARERRAADAATRRQEADGATVQRVFTLNNLTRPRVGADVVPLRVETVLSAIELVTTEDGKVPTLRYHADSGLLLVRGTDAQVGNASEALAVLANDLDAREARAQRSGRAPAAAKDLPAPRETR